jgi:hypothetical protein
VSLDTVIDEGLADGRITTIEFIHTIQTQTLNLGIHDNASLAAIVALEVTVTFLPMPRANFAQPDKPKTV